MTVVPRHARPRAAGRIAGTRQVARSPRGRIDHVAARQTRSCSNAKAVAAVREDTRSLARMFCTWRATVCSLTTSSGRSARLRLAGATRRRTSSSRGVRPCDPSAGAPRGASTRASVRRRARATRTRSRAASSSSARCHRRRARGRRGRAGRGPAPTSYGASSSCQAPASACAARRGPRSGVPGRELDGAADVRGDRRRASRRPLAPRSPQLVAGAARLRDVARRPA